MTDQIVAEEIVDVVMTSSLTLNAMLPDPLTVNYNYQLTHDCALFAQTNQFIGIIVSKVE